MQIERAWLSVLLVFMAALVMGLPTLRGSFVGADDHRLVLNHILVNHPSIEHALELFKVVHRDLYQPIPLLSFSMEFAVAGKLGLFDEGIDGGAWLFHLTNLILHALNAVLVWAVILSMKPAGNGEALPVLHPEGRRNGLEDEKPPSKGNRADRADAALQREHTAAWTFPAVAILAGLLFAIHPLQVEVVAWVNGRMMLLSTLFGLASLLALSVWLRTGRPLWAVWTCLFVLCCAVSKIRVGLPVLLLIVPLAQRRKLKPAYWLLWSICVAITALFVWVNYAATDEAGMFEGAVANLHGPRAARALMALAWYFQHFLWPTGLASWYPTPGLVRWSDPTVVRAIVVVTCAFAIIGFSALRSRNAALAFIWFFSTIASTVQLVPTRNALAADRYMYLPIIGLIWVVGMALVGTYESAMRRWGRRPVRLGAGGVGMAMAIVMVALSWHTASFYETPILKGTRIASLAPTTPHVWERVAWAYNRAGRYAEAIEIAQREFEHDDTSAQSAALQVIGASQMRLGRANEAVETLKRAIEVDPESPTAKNRLATVLHDLGRTDQALPLFELAVAEAPLKNPWIVRLASLYRKLGRADDARPLYEQALQNNPYEVPAILGLAELDIETGSRSGYLAAEKRLTGLLEWMPENANARVDLGVVYHALGRTEEAIQTYQRVLEIEPANATAAINLAEIYNSRQDVIRAGQLFENAASLGLEALEHLVACHDFFISQQMPGRSLQLWTEFLTRFPDSLEGRAFLAWSHALAGNTVKAAAHAEPLAAADPPVPLALATLVYVALVNEDYDAALTRTEDLCATDIGSTGVRQRLLRALGVVVQQKPDIPWSFCLAARLWIADGQFAPAQEFIELCAQRCDGAACSEYVRSLHALLATRPPQSP